MLAFLAKNWGSIVAGLFVLALVVLCVRSLIRSKKNGSSCGGNCAGCSGCAYSSKCSKQE